MDITSGHWTSMVILSVPLSADGLTSCNGFSPCNHREHQAVPSCYTLYLCVLYTHHCIACHVGDMCTSLCCTVSCNYKIWCLAVLLVPQACQSALVDIFHPQCATPILMASYCHLFLSSTLHDSTLEGCGILQPLRSVAEYVVPHAMCL